MTFPTTSTPPADYKTVRAECGTSGPTANVLVIGLEKILWDHQGTWMDAASQMYVKKGSTIQYRAVGQPAGGGWPEGKPVWTVDGVTTGTGGTKYVTFDGVPPASRTVVAECGDTPSILVYTADAEFSKLATQVFGYDDFTTQPIAGPWKSILIGSTDSVVATMTQAGAASATYFSSSTSPTLTATPVHAAGGPQTVTTVTLTSDGSAANRTTSDITAGLNGTSGDVIAALRVVECSTHTSTLAIRVVNEENDDEQPIPKGQGGGIPNQVCISAGPNGFRDTPDVAVGGDDLISGTNVLTGTNGICETLANHTPLTTTIPYTAQELREYLAGVYGVPRRNSRS